MPFARPLFEGEAVIIASGDFGYGNAGNVGFDCRKDVDGTLHGIAARVEPIFFGRAEGVSSLHCGSLTRLACRTGIAQPIAALPNIVEAHGKPDLNGQRPSKKSHMTSLAEIAVDPGSPVRTLRPPGQE